MARKKKIDMNGYESVPDWTGYCPDCPQCGETMGYSYFKSEFKCPSCGYIMDDADWDYEETFDPEDFDPDKIPFGCAACGGPWPSCQTSCKLYDD